MCAICRVDEIIRRRAITEQVEDRVNFDKIRTLFRMIYLRKKFTAKMEEKRREALNAGSSNTHFTAIVLFLIPFLYDRRP